MVRISKQISENRDVSPKEKMSEKEIFSNILRPLHLSDYIGQKSIKKYLNVSIRSAKLRNTPIDHMLFYGPPGLGKTTLANIIAGEMGTHLKSTSGPAIEKQSDLVSILSNLEEGDILFIDEIHRLRSQIEEILYTAMEDFHIDIIVGSGTGAQSVKLPVKEFTLIGATTKLSALSSPLRDRFGNILKLDFYDKNDIGEILKQNTKKLEISLPENSRESIAKRSRGTPRIANRILKIIRDYSVIGENIGDQKTLEKIFLDIGIDEMGLDYLDKKYLDALHHQFVGGPIGLGTLASALGEEESTLEEVVEPYLLQIGFIERTPRGRKLGMHYHAKAK